MQKPGELKKPLQPGTLRKNGEYSGLACVLCGSKIQGHHELFCPLVTRNPRQPKGDDGPESK